MVNNTPSAIIFFFIAGIVVILIEITVLEFNTPKSSRLMKVCDNLCGPSKVDVFEYDIESDEIKTCRCLR